MRTINHLIVHCAATRREWMEGRPLKDKVAAIRKWHTNRSWDDIGYHYVIDRDGSVAKGREDSVQGAHTRGQNRNSLGICLLGGHGSAADDEFQEHFTQEQEAALVKLLDDLQAKYPISKISGHNQFSNKACPGFYVPKWLAEVESIKAKESQPQLGFVEALKALFQAMFPRRST